MSDDVSMNALRDRSPSGPGLFLPPAATSSCTATASSRKMREVAAETPELSGEALERARRALGARKAPQAFDRAAARGELDELD